MSYFTVARSSYYKGTLHVFYFDVAHKFQESQVLSGYFGLFFLTAVAFL